MAETFARGASKLDPGPAWTVVTDAPLKGMALAREAMRVVAWDENDQINLVDANGQSLGSTRAPGKILYGAVSDDGSLIAFIGEGNRLWILGADLETIDDRQVVMDPTGIAIDPHGRYIAVASKLNLVQFYNRFGKTAGKFETRQHLSLLAFVPTELFIVGVGAFGSISGYELTPRAGGKFDGDLAWTEQLMSGVGSLAVNSDGGMILLGCFNLGVQRFDIRGHNEGAYHLGGSASCVATDFAGRMIAVATQEGELAILSNSGAVRWRTGLPRPITALEVDPLCRFVIYGMATGEIVKLDLFGGGKPGGDTPEVAAITGRPGSGPVRKPDWTSEVVPNEDQAEFSVLAVVDEPTRIGVITSKNRLELYSASGKKVGQAPDIQGVGRILRTAPGWIAAATDRQIMVCDLVKNTAQKVDISMVEITHLAIQPDTYGLAIVQERDRIGRATIAGRWIWKAELNVPVEEVAIGPNGTTAITTENGLLRVYDAGGTMIGEYRAHPVEPLFLSAAPEGAPANVAWVTLARRHQVIRGHDISSRVLWEAPVPWESWSIHVSGPLIVIAAADGRALAFDGAGRVRAQGGRSEGTLDAFAASRSGEALRISKQGVHVICSTLEGRVEWRAFADAPLGPLAVGRTGVAIMIGKSLAWFGDRPAAT